MLMHIVLLALQVAAPGRRPGQWGAARSITDAEHCLWLGDLNYRWGDSTELHSCDILSPGCIVMFILRHRKCNTAMTWCLVTSG